MVAENQVRNPAINRGENRESRRTCPRESNSRLLSPGVFIFLHRSQCPTNPTNRAKLSGSPTPDELIVRECEV